MTHPHAGHGHGKHPHPHAAFAPNADYVYEHPRRVYWELTRACALACSHCRAEALHRRLPDELSRDEAFGVLETLAATTPKPVVILTGGDPLERPDFWEILAHARELGLHVDVAPSATPKLTREAIMRLAEAGVGAMSLSVDGATAPTHDALRGIEGCFERTMEAAADIADAGISLQVNTLVTADTLPEMAAIAGVAEQMKARRWSLFFLVTTGRGSTLPQITAAQTDELVRWALAEGERRPYVVATTEAPFARRVLLEKKLAAGAKGRPRVPGAGMRDGNGIMFLSYKGEVMPSGFLPLSAGNVRDEDPIAIYQRSEIFVKLRDVDAFGGRCGRCEHRRICGGSRGRAFAATGDVMAEDPLCTYEPAEG